MNQWANTVLTDKGAALLSKLTQGNTLNFTKAIVGSGYVTPGTLPKQTAVAVPQQQLEFRPVAYPEEGKCTITVALRNDKLAAGYEATQVGIYATDPDEGEILFFIAQAVDADSGTMVPSEAEMPGYSAEWNFYLQYGQADGIVVTVDPTGTVSRNELEQYVAGAFRPITTAEIDALIGWTGSGGGDWDPGEGGSGVATLDHSLLYNRNIANQHSIGSITGLEDALNKAEGEQVVNADISSAWENA